MKNNYIKTEDVLMLVVLCLMLILYMGYGALYIILSAVFCVIVGLNTPFSRLFDKQAKRIVLFSLSYSLICFFNGSITNKPFLAFFAICPVFFYIFGKYIAKKINSSEILSWFFILITICFAASCYRLALTGAQFQTLEYADERVLFDASGDEMLGSTGVGIFVSLGLSGLALFIATNSLSKKNRLVWLGLFLLSAYMTLFFLNRSGLMVALFCVVLLMLRQQYGGNKRKMLFIILLLLILVYILSLKGTFDIGIFNAYEDRLSNAEDDRLRRWVEAAGLVLSHPFGFSSLTGYYVHNLWLDIARVSGLIPFLIMIIVTIHSLKRLWGIVKTTAVDFSCILLCMMICMLLSSSVEPLIEANPIYFMLMLMLFGMVEHYSITMLTDSCKFYK